MSARRTATRLGLALSIASGCGPASAPHHPAPAPAAVATAPAPAAATAPATPTASVDPLPAQVEAVVRGYEAIAAAAGPDAPCPGLAEAITAAATATVADRAAVRVAQTGERAADVDALMVAAGARLIPAVATLDAAVGRCGGEPAVGHALDALDR